MATRRSRKPLVAVIVIVVLLGLVVAADRLIPFFGERVIASQLQDSQHLPSKPDVDITGFPFLTQLINGNLDKVTVDAKELPLGEDAHGARLRTLDTVMRDVHAADNFHQLRAGTLTASGETSYAELSKAIGEGDFTYAGNGRIKLEESVTVAGQKFGASVTAEPVVDDRGRLYLRNTKIDSDGPLISAVSDGLQTIVDAFGNIRIPLDGIPFGLTPTSVAVAGNGVHFALAGRDVNLTQKQ